MSEKVKGIYDAMNKGISPATWDIVGILNSDNFYIHTYLLEEVLKEFVDKQGDGVLADLVYVKPKSLDKIVRHYDSSYFSPIEISFVGTLFILRMA